MDELVGTPETIEATPQEKLFAQLQQMVATAKLAGEKPNIGEAISVFKTYAAEHGFAAFNDLRAGMEFLANPSSGQLRQLAEKGETSLINQRTVEEALISLNEGIPPELRGAFFGAADALTSKNHREGIDNAVTYDLKTFGEVIENLRSAPQHTVIEFNVEMNSFTSRAYCKAVAERLDKLQEEEPEFCQRVINRLSPEMTGREHELATEREAEFIATLELFKKHGIAVGVDDVKLDDDGVVIDPRLGGPDTINDKLRNALQAIKYVKLDTGIKPLKGEDFDLPFNNEIAEAALRNLQDRAMLIGTSFSYAFERISSRAKFDQVIGLMPKFFGLEITAQGFFLSGQRPGLTAERTTVLAPDGLKDKRPAPVSTPEERPSTKAGKGWGWKRVAAFIWCCYSGRFITYQRHSTVFICAACGV